MLVFNWFSLINIYTFSSFCALCLLTPCCYSWLDKEVPAASWVKVRGLKGQREVVRMKQQSCSVYSVVNRLSAAQIHINLGRGHTSAGQSGWCWADTVNRYWFWWPSWQKWSETFEKGISCIISVLHSFLRMYCTIWGFEFVCTPFANPLGMVQTKLKILLTLMPFQRKIFFLLRST